MSAEEGRLNDVASVRRSRFLASRRLSEVYMLRTKRGVTTSHDDAVNLMSDVFQILINYEVSRVNISHHILDYCRILVHYNQPLKSR